MRISIRGGNVVTASGVLKHASLIVDNGRIAALGTHVDVGNSAEIGRCAELGTQVNIGNSAELGTHVDNGRSADMDTPSSVDDLIIDAAGCYVMPGFIDLHIHGGAGMDVTDSDDNAIESVCRYHAQHGTTGLLMTTRTMPMADINNTLQRLAAYMKAPHPLGSRPLGIHLEGPFINETYKGAQSAQYICPPSLEIMKRWIEIAEGHIKLVTLAPELEQSDAVISWLDDQGVIVSAGHCGPDYEQMIKAIDLGVRHITHCFNGMRGFSHRDPGMLAALLMDERVTVELIMDTIHVHPAAGKLLLHNKGTQGVVLITDAIRAAGMPDGEYSSAGGRTITVDHGEARLPSGSLAGSTLSMNQALGNAVKHMGVSVAQASVMASLTPATILGIDQHKGCLSVGKDADVVITDVEFNVLLTMREGQIVYQAQ